MDYVLNTALLTARLHAAIYAPLNDSVEIYNYWEPLNFLIRLFGKQSTIYDPINSFGSYVYLIPFSLFSYPLKFLNLQPYVFIYLIRIILSILFTIAEIKLSKTLKFLNKNIKYWFLFFQLLNPGMYQASVSILPNSIALLLSIVSTNYIIAYFNTEKFIKSIDDELLSLENKIENKKESENVDDLSSRTNILLNLYRISIPLINKYYTIATILISIATFSTYPSAILLILPFSSYILINSLIYSPKSVLKNNFSKSKTFMIYSLSTLSCIFFIPFFISQIDSLFYSKITYISYNSLSLFKLSNFNTYHIENLLLNQNILFILALINLLSGFNKYQLFIYKLPLIIYITFYSFQNPSIDSSMYPIYHLISISAAQLVSSSCSLSFCKLLKKSINFIIITISLLLFLSRVNNLINNETASIKIFKHLTDSTTDNNYSPYLQNICIDNKDFFPSSFFLNNNQRLKFLSNENNIGDYNEFSNYSFDNLINSTSSHPIPFELVNCDYLITSQNLDDSYDILLVENLIIGNGFEFYYNFENFLNEFLINPWFELQKDLSVIELNRKLMQMYGIKNPNGKEMFTGLYENLNCLKNCFISYFGNYFGNVESIEIKLARKY